MPIHCDPLLYSAVREEHLIHNDFFLRYVDFGGEVPSRLAFTCLSGERELLRVCYGPEEIAARLGTTPKAVEHRLDRGRRRLREKLMERGVDL